MLPELSLAGSSRWPALGNDAFLPPVQHDALFRLAAEVAAQQGITGLSLPPASAAVQQGQHHLHLQHHHQQHLLQHLGTHGQHHSAQGCLAAFSIVFLGELGDKTFFTAALLAMRVGRGVSFAGSMLALGAMSLISVGIGRAFAAAPPAWSSGWPVGEVLGVLLLLFFGLSALRKAMRESFKGRASSTGGAAQAVAATKHSAGHPGRQHTAGSTHGSSSLHNSNSSSSGSGSGSGSNGGLLGLQHSDDSLVSSVDDLSHSSDDSSDEFDEAQRAVEAAASRGLLGGPGSGSNGSSGGRVLLRSVLEVAVVMFLAEWGDRSMLATVALGAAQSPWGVAAGAAAAYAAATGLAVVAGALAAKHISEQTLDAISGLLFLVFAAASIVTML